ncbi:hypothetical protein F2Q70_00043028 [Brassica cretica]|uniref:Tryptophan synthase beta chain-like PALP domain-containing protein n=1 Tax=Brassica cretica TaxID=69181 RepID=A0A8S9KIN2_BRACR|nr:hypothetical protein F2Q70_00043028 [Brassica cretica]
MGDELGERKRIEKEIETALRVRDDDFRERGDITRTVRASLDCGEKQIWSEPEDHQPRSSDKVQLSRRKRLVGGGLNRLQGESSDYDKEIYDYENDRALESGKLFPGGIVTEGSAGSTAISLATVAPAYGCQCHVVIPDDAAIEKSQIIEALGATVERVRPVSITHKDHFVNIARRRADEANDLASSKRRLASGINVAHQGKTNGCTAEEEKEPSLFSESVTGGFFADQFENLANYRAHYEGTGPEIWQQTHGNVDAFVAAAGTGGTLAGVSRFLQEKNEKVKCFLIDPPGSGLYNKVTRGVMYTREEAEGRRLKNPFDTITEGIGINRLTQNFLMAKIDGGFRGTDKEAVEMSR